MSDPLSSIEERTRAAIETVYRRFAAPAPRAIEGCPCCISKRGVDVLLATPLRELTGQALWSYVSGVFYTVGSERDFRYFLPRILDVAINDPGASEGNEVALGKIGLAGWQSWRADERAAIEDLVDVWIERALARDLAEAAQGWVGWETELVLCGAARAGLPLARRLARLQEPDAAPLVEDLKQRFPRHLSAFWKDAPAGLEELSAILTAA